MRRAIAIARYDHGEKTLDTLFHDTLRDIYHAERKILKSPPKMASAAQSPELNAAFEKQVALP